jgi:hypothetical protein
VPLPYLVLLIGAWLLLRDIAGRSLARAAAVRFRRRVGLVVAAGPGIAPIIYFGTGGNGGAPSLSPIGVGYLALYLIFAAGLLEILPSQPARLARRTGYAGLLLLGALPSWGLLFLAPFTTLAGVGLVEPDDRLRNA